MMFWQKMRGSLRYRFLSIVVVVLAIGTLVLSAVVAVSVRAMLDRSLMTKAQGLASLIAKLSQDPLALKDGIGLDAIVNDANRDEDVVYTVIRDARGTIMTSRYASINVRSPRVKATLAGLPKDSRLPEILAAIRKDLSVRELTVPVAVDIRTIGSVTIGMSDARIRHEVRKTVLVILALNLVAAFVLGLVLVVSSKRVLLTPISELASAAARLAKGDLSGQITVEASGELKTLVHSFNQMAADIRKTTVSKDYVDNIIASIRDALLVTSSLGAISRVNAAACFLLGRDERELIGAPLDQVIVDAAGGEGSTVAEILQSSSLSGKEKVCLARDGRNVPVLFSASVMRDGDGEVMGIVGVARDITALKQSEAQLKSYSRDLQEVNEELKSFAYIVSHDLRAPLVNIRGFSEELGRSLAEIGPSVEKHLPLFDETEKKRIWPLFQQDIPEALGFIRSSVERMDGQINAILKLSRAGRRKLVPEPLQMGDLVRGILQTLTHQLESRAVAVTVEGLPDLVADRMAMEQIFGNLLDNAVKYLDPARPGAIAVTAENDGREIVVHVRDNGRGMAQEDIPKAFELFRRVGKQDMPGEGLGLAYVRALVRSMGGRIWCRSELGKGTTFSFSVSNTAPGTHEPM
jgi:PAS domain S-box-containing protein